MSRAWMPLYVADYLADTIRLTTVEHGAYLLLIIQYWNDGSLPSDDDELARIVRMPKRDWMKIRSRIAPFFREGWKHKRIDEELAKASEISDRRKASASKRWSKPDAIASPIADANDVHRAGVPQPQPQKDNIPAQHTEPAALGAIGLEFDRVTAECTQAISPALISDLTIGPMVELFRKYGKERVIFQLVSESRRTRQRPVKTWRLWAEIVSERLVEAHGVDPPKPKENGRPIDIGSMAPMPEDNLRRAVQKWRENPQSWAPQWGDPPDENSKIQRWLAEVGETLAAKKLEVA